MDNKEINLYELFKTYSYSELKDLFKNAKTDEEREFYIALCNIVLRREHKKLLSNNVLNN